MCVCMCVQYMEARAHLWLFYWAQLETLTYVFDLHIWNIYKPNAALRQFGQLSISISISNSNLYLYLFCVFYDTIPK